MARESVLTQRSVVADDTLAMITGQPKGSYVSYTELTRGLHAYIKSKQLRLKACVHCKGQIPGYATFCDSCGNQQ